MIKWLVGIVSAVIVAVIAYWATDFLKSYLAEPPNWLTGTWEYTMYSNLSKETHKGRLNLTMDGDVVSGVMDQFDPSDRAVSGTFKNGTLSMHRETRYKGTVQFYDLKKVNDKRFSGTFRNEGPEPDNGKIEISR